MCASVHVYVCVQWGRGTLKKDLFTKWPPTLYTRAKTLLLLFPITQKVSSILFFFFSPLSPSFSLVHKRTQHRPGASPVCQPCRPPGGSEGFEKFPRTTDPPLPPPHRHRHSTDFIVPRLPTAADALSHSHSLTRAAQSSPVVCTNMAAAFEPSLRHRRPFTILRHPAGQTASAVWSLLITSIAPPAPGPEQNPNTQAGPYGFFHVYQPRLHVEPAVTAANARPPWHRFAMSRRPFTMRHLPIGARLPHRCRVATGRLHVEHRANTDPGEY